MILIIYFIISILVFIMLCMYNFSGINRVKNKYSNKPKSKRCNDLSGIILSWLKAILVSFIPLYNLVMLFALIFCGDQINKRTDEILEKAYKSDNPE